MLKKIFDKLRGNKIGDKELRVNAMENTKGIDSAEESNKNRIKKSIMYFGLAVFVIILWEVALMVYDDFKNSTPEYKKRQEERTKSMTSESGENRYFQQTTQQELSDINKALANLSESMKELKENNKNTQEAYKKQIDQNKTNIVNVVSEQNQTIEEQWKRLNETNNNIKNLETKFETISKKIDDIGKGENVPNNKQFSQIQKEIENFKKELENIKKDVKNNEKLSINNIEDNQTSLEKPRSQKEENNTTKQAENNAISRVDDVEVVHIQFSSPTLEYEDTSLKKEQVTANQENKNDTLDIHLGVAKGYLFSGAEAKIAGFNGQGEENAPVGIQLLSNMTIANGNYTQVEDCMLLGSAKGELATNRAIIRLVKISCIFQDTSGKKYVATGNIKGWVYDENSSLGVSGTLISREGKIIQTAIPLTLLETGLNYLKNSSTNVFIDGNNITNSLGKAFNSGFSNGGGESLQKLIEYYNAYLEAMSPSIAFRAGRKVSILFQGGESFKLKPYVNHESYDGLGIQKVMENVLDNNQKEILIGE